MTLMADNQITLPSHLGRDKREVADIAVMLGWKLQVSSNGVSVSLVPPDGSPSIHLGRRDSIPVKRMMRQVVKHCDMEKLLLAKASGSLPDHILRSLPMLGDPGTVEVEPLPEPVVQAPVQRQALVTKPEPTITSIRPMVARRSDSHGYESETTNVRKWSDGTEDFQCTACDYTSPDRLGVSRHYGNTHSRGLGTQPRPETFQAEVQGATYAPQQRRIDALAEVLVARFSDEEKWDWRDVARDALVWQHEQSRKGTDLAGEAEDLSAEDTLNRIRRLLDTGKMAESQRRIEALEAHLVESERQFQEQVQRVAEAETEARRAQETLDSFIDLARSLRTDDHETP